jgi:hypothetical protein
MRTGTEPVVAAVAGDPGGANALGPVIEALLTSGRRVQAFAYRQAAGVWRYRGLAYQELTETMSVPDAIRCLQAASAGVLLAATSCNGVNLEQRFVAAARRLGTPSLAVLDFWSNYRLRFTDERGAWADLPDRIAVMDEWARAEMIAEGFAAERLCVTGLPALDDLERCRAGFTPEARARLRARWGCRTGEKLVLFASQPLAALTGSGAMDLTFPGYTEHTVLAAVVPALDRLARRRGARILLLIRPHPREDAAALRGLAGEAVRVVVDGSGDGREVALTCDLVAGMSTVLLVEACLLGCVVVSLQPGLSRPDALPTNRWGSSRAVYRAQDIEPALDSLLFDEAARRQYRARTLQHGVRPGAAARVVQLLDCLAARIRTGEAS